MKTTRVTTTTGKRITLYTDDTLTLALKGMEETTPQKLRALVCEKSLKLISESSEDPCERTKAQRSLEFDVQFSDHGSGRKSVQVFSGSNLVLDYNL